MHRQSAYLIGRDRKVNIIMMNRGEVLTLCSPKVAVLKTCNLFVFVKVVDFPVDHPSCSKQHAVLQYRLVDYLREDGRKGKKVK